MLVYVFGGIHNSDVVAMSSAPSPLKSATATVSGDGAM